MIPSWARLAFAVFAVDPLRYLAMYPEFVIDPAQREAFAKTRTGAIAGKRLADRYGWKVGQKLPIASEIHPKADGSLAWEFDLVGTFDADDPAVRGNTDIVLINVAYFDEARQFGRGKTGWYIIRIADAGHARAVSAEIDRLFAQHALLEVAEHRDGRPLGEHLVEISDRAEVLEEGLVRGAGARLVAQLSNVRRGAGLLVRVCHGSPPRRR